ncbi:hypothetical protein N656DRAFT_444196 [Canariomyces notabilis]|uniref:Uncharacterized protein n=1 Tax=Canariomyces notabilis TaxID=2074819 RepID=A0AAN6T803_9PEZI|nr:hypothetical protein N656DRAFT_444196 [Canariomyces arenarius]
MSMDHKPERPVPIRSPPPSVVTNTACRPSPASITSSCSKRIEYTSIYQRPITYSNGPYLCSLRWLAVFAPLPVQVGTPHLLYQVLESPPRSIWFEYLGRLGALLVQPKFLMLNSSSRLPLLTEPADGRGIEQVPNLTRQGVLQVDNTLSTMPSLVNKAASYFLQQPASQQKMDTI